MCGAERSAVILPWPEGLISHPFGLHLVAAGSSDLEEVVNIIHYLIRVEIDGLPQERATHETFLYISTYRITP